MMMENLQDEIMSIKSVLKDLNNNRDNLQREIDDLKLIIEKSKKEEEERVKIWKAFKLITSFDPERIVSVLVEDDCLKNAIKAVSDLHDNLYKSTRCVREEERKLELKESEIVELNRTINDHERRLDSLKIRLSIVIRETRARIDELEKLLSEM